MSKIISFGEAIIDFIPVDDIKSLLEADKFLKTPGGSIANVAITIAKLGGASYFAGKVGDDSFGHYLGKNFEKYGVNTNYLMYSKEAKTGLFFYSAEKKGNNKCVAYRNPSADMLFTASEIKEDWFDHETVFHFGSDSLIYSYEAIIKAIKFTQGKGSLISFDPNLHLSLWSNKEEAENVINSIIPFVDILKVNEFELSFLLSEKEIGGEDLINTFLKEGTSLVIVTKAGKGSSYYTREFSGDISTLEIDEIDPMGAGDAFVGGLLYQFANENITKHNIKSKLNDKVFLERLIMFSNVCGALTATKRGVVSALPKLEEVNNYI